MSATVDKFTLQDSQYSFPYHYLPHFDRHNNPRLGRSLSWGVEYLTYMSAVLDEVERLPASTILDVGCGDGWLLNHLSRNDIVKHGIDISSRAIAFACAFAVDAHFEVQDLSALSSTYGIVCLTEVLEHIPDVEIVNFVALAKALVESGGYLVLSVPTTVRRLNPKHHRHYDEALLDRHFGGLKDWALIVDKRVYGISIRSMIVQRLLHNRIWTINAGILWRIFWRWHVRHNFRSDRKHGAHIVRVYRRVS